MTKSVVAFSGGQDSTVCLALEMMAGHQPTAITFSYGQKHVIEVARATEIARILNVPHKTITLSFVPEIVVSALTSSGDPSVPHPISPTLPSSYVPGRNALFLSIAHAYAQTIGATRIVTGVSQTDSSGYPDCRATFIQQLEQALNSGSNTHIEIVAPLMSLDKAAVWELAEQAGVLDLVRTRTHTCYEGSTKPHEWGAGCGHCPACKLRERGWSQYVLRK